MVPKEWASSVMCFAKLEVVLWLCYAVLCSLYREANLPPVCPIYALWQSGQVNLYIPDREYLSCGRSLWLSRLANVCVVRNAILRYILLKMFVMYGVSLPVYVKLARFCVVCVVTCLFGLGVVGLCGFIGKVLLCGMLCITFSS